MDNNKKHNVTFKEYLRLLDRVSKLNYNTFTFSSFKSELNAYIDGDFPLEIVAIKFFEMIKRNIVINNGLTFRINRPIYNYYNKLLKK